MLDEIRMPLLVASWLSMLTTLCSALFATLIQSDIAVFVMFVSIVVWSFSGITYIKIKRTTRESR